MYALLCSLLLCWPQMRHLLSSLLGTAYAAYCDVPD